jgi:hypothetical protein
VGRLFVKRGGQWARVTNGVSHVLRELRSQRRVKIGTDMGRPAFSDERDATIADHGYDCCRYFLASRAPVPSPDQATAYGTFKGARLTRLNALRKAAR